MVSDIDNRISQEISDFSKSLHFWQSRCGTLLILQEEVLLPVAGGRLCSLRNIDLQTHVGYKSDLLCWEYSQTMRQKTSVLHPSDAYLWKQFCVCFSVTEGYSGNSFWPLLWSRGQHSPFCFCFIRQWQTDCQGCSDSLSVSLQLIVQLTSCLCRRLMHRTEQGRGSFASACMSLIGHVNICKPWRKSIVEERNSSNRLWEHSLFYSRRMGDTRIRAYRTIRRIRAAVWWGSIEPFK